MAWSLNPSRLTRPIRRTGPLGYEESWEWDARDRILSHRLAGATTSFSYEGQNTTPSAIVEPGGALTEIEVSGDDLPVAVVDADGVATRYAWDQDGQLAGTTDALGNATTASYDPAGHLAAWRLPSSITLSYDSDEAGRVRSALTPTAAWSWRWSPAGRALGGEEV